MPKPVKRSGNIYTRTTGKYRGGESVSSKRLSNKTVGYNKRIHGPEFPITTSYQHVNTPQCKHCQGDPPE